MKLCPKCEQPLAQEITTCPACGSDAGAGRTHIDDYRILGVLHEGHASLLCRAVREPTGEKVMIRLFTRRSGVDREVARRLQSELERLKKLPDDGFVRHQEIRRSSEGLWYRVSEWVEAENWGSLLASGRLRDLRVKLELFHRMATLLAVLHRHGHIIPHLILNDVMVVRDRDGKFDARIDYKLSRFLDPQMDRPGPMLEHLLAIHPDIANRRPLDSRSDVWSLGKVFVEVLAGDLDIADPEAAVDELPIPDELKVLLRVMLADDPDLRPQSMDEIAAALSRIGRTESPEAPAGSSETVPSQASSIRRLQRRLRLLALGVVLISLAGVVAWYLGWQRRDVEGILEGYANRYVQSVAFVLVDYWLEGDEKRVYRNLSEGTAFLADEEGYLLTSRHVVCPWLEDGRLLHAAKKLRDEGVVPRLDYRIHLWFEGQRAFNLAGRFLENPDVADFFFTDSAFSTEPPARLTIAGVVRPPVRTRQLIAAPLNDDIAVIKVDGLPRGLTPLPLDPSFDPQRVPRLARVIALGFPLGSRTQEDTVNASAVDGHVRRSFHNMLQIDSSLHGGNSGGPIIDARGNVIGIVSAVAVDRTEGMFATNRPLADIGLIHPITGAANLLAEVKAGRVKWNGVLDFTLHSTIAAIRETALRGRWAEARALAERKLEGNVQTELLTACGMMAFCTGDLPAARLRFSQVRSTDPDDGQAALMLYLVDWLSGGAAGNADHRELTAADWRSRNEFEGHLVRMLENGIPLESDIEAWNNRAERSWLSFIAGLLHERGGRSEEAEASLREAVLASSSDSWSLYLALGKLEQLFNDRRVELRTENQWAAHRARVDAFRKATSESRSAMRSREEQTAPLLAKLSGRGLDVKERLKLLEQIRALEPDDFDVTAALAFYHAADGNWPKAQEYTREFLERGDRPTAARMSLGLLEAGLLRYQGWNDRAEERLEAYESLVRDDWYFTIGEHLLGRVDAETLETRAQRRPEDLLTANTILGFWAESSGDNERALAHYKEALGSFLDDWLEYDFARERIKRLRDPESRPVSPVQP